VSTYVPGEKQNVVPDACASNTLWRLVPGETGTPEHPGERGDAVADAFAVPACFPTPLAP
jgi:hypothetical protein